MKKSLLFCLVILISIAISGCQRSPDGYHADGKPFYLKTYEGKWVIVNYWAPWCNSCLKEIPELNELYTKYPEKLVVLGISFDDLSPQEIQAFAKKNKIGFPLLKEFAKEKWDIETLEAIPLTLVFSPDRQLIKILKGPQTQNDLLNVIHKNKSPSEKNTIPPQKP